MHMEHITRALLAKRLEDEDGTELAKMLADEWGAARTIATIAALMETAAYLDSLSTACRVAIDRLRSVR